MSIACDVILSWSATPQQLSAVGGALWRWCNRTAGDTGIYQFLDNQPLADLIAGRSPELVQTPRQPKCQRVHLMVRDVAYHDRQATIASLRRAMPTGGITDIVVDGKSWDLID